MVGRAAGGSGLGWEQLLPEPVQLPASLQLDSRAEFESESGWDQQPLPVPVLMYVQPQPAPILV